MATANYFRLNVFNYLWLLIIPLSYNFWSTDPALYHKFFLIDVSLLALVGLLFTGTKQIQPLTKSTLIFSALYAASILLALPGLILNHVNYADGWFVWLELAVFPVFVLLLCLSGTTGIVQRKAISKIVSWLAVASIVIGLAQYLLEISNTQWTLSAADAVKCTYANKNIFAEVILLTLPFTFFAFTATRKKWYLSVFAATIIMITLTLSRAVFAATLVATVFTAFIYTLANRKQAAIRKYGIAVLVSITMMVIAGYLVKDYTSLGQHLTSFYNNRNTIHERQVLWHSTQQLIQSYPYFGTGLGAWKILSMQYCMLGLRNYTTFFQQPHTDLLWIISEQGIISFIFLALAWMCLVALLFRNIFRKPAEIFNYCLLFGLAGYLVYSNFAFPRERAEHGIFLAFIAAFILSDADTKPSFKLPRAGGFVLAVLLVIAAWWAGNKTMSQVDFLRVLEYREANDLQQELESLNKINSTYYTLDGTATPIAWYRGMVYYAQHDNSAALAEFQEAVKLNPYHAYSLANVGTCLSAAGYNDSAAVYFRRALIYSDGFPNAALNLCALKFSKGEIDSAAWYLSAAHDDLTDARYVKFLNVVTTSLVKKMKDSIDISSETLLTQKFNSLITNPQWQMDIFQKAFKYQRPVKEQIWLDVLWIVKNGDGNTDLADKYMRLLNLSLN